MRHSLPGVVRAAILGLALLPMAPAFSAGGPLRQFALRDSYQIGEGGRPSAAANQANPSLSPSADSSAGPIRLARFSYVKGNVTWRMGDGEAWSAATVNLPIRQGAQVWVTDGGRAEVQFDDGSLLRLGNGAVATLQTLFSDADGEFTEIQMNEGLSTLVLRPSKSIYQIDTPLVSIKSEGPSKVRIGVDNDVEVAVRSGRAAVEGSGRKTVLESGRYLDLVDADSEFNSSRLPDPDSWDRWNDARDRQLAEGDSGDRLPSDIALVAGDLDDYGSWHDDARYGAVWCPAVSEAGWRPYQHGHWTWVEPFGWTWVSGESWGWAPYHYGTWVNEPYGWAWVPGPARQYWCPAVVHFSEYNGSIAWAPLCPSEVRYPSERRLGYRGEDWSLLFSIGRAAVYYPYNDSYCEARPFDNVVVNRVTYVNNVTNIYNINNVNNGSRTDIRNTTINRNTYFGGTQFVPFNARNAAGVTTATVASFGGRGEYQAAPRTASAFFLRGRSIGAPAAGSAPVAGPISARPTAMAFTPSRDFLPNAHPASPILRRQLFRAALPAPVAQVAPSSPRYQAFGQRPGAVRAGDSSPSRAADGNAGRFRDTGRPAAPRSGALEGTGALRSHRPSFPSQGAGGPVNPGDGGRQAASDARRSLGQPISGVPCQPTPERMRPGAVSERRYPDAPAASGENPFRRTRPVQEVPREPIRPRPAPEALRPARAPEPPARESPPPPPAPEPAPREETRPDPRPAPPENKPEDKPASGDDHSGDRPRGGRSRG